MHSPFGLRQDGAVDLPHLALRRAQPAPEAISLLLHQTGAAGAEQLVGVQLLMDLYSAGQLMHHSSLLSEISPRTSVSFRQHVLAGDHSGGEKVPTSIVDVQVHPSFQALGGHDHGYPLGGQVLQAPHQVPGDVTEAGAGDDQPSQTVSEPAHCLGAQTRIEVQQPHVRLHAGVRLHLDIVLRMALGRHLQAAVEVQDGHRSGIQTTERITAAGVHLADLGPPVSAGVRGLAMHQHEDPGRIGVHTEACRGK